MNTLLHQIRVAAAPLLSGALLPVFLLTLLGPAVCISAAADRNVIHFGAVPDDKVFDTKAIQAAIDACGKGDRVVVPAGKFLVATIWVKSNMTLYLSEGAVLESSSDWRDFSGDNWSWSNAMIRSRNNTNNVTIEGPGLIDGVDCFSPKGEVGMRGPHAIYLSGKGQSNIRISGITIVRAANYAIMVGQGSRGVTIENVKVRGGFDGFDFNRGTDVTVTGCDFRTGDDCIAGVANQDVKILNSRFNSSMQGVRITGNNVVIRDCKFWGPGEYEHRKQKTNLSRPAIWPPDWKRGQPNTPSDNWLIENCTFSNIGVAYKYSKGADGFGVRRITFNNITATPPENSNASPIAISGEEARIIINGGDFSVGSNSPTIIDIQNFDHLELHNVTLRIDGGRPAIRARNGNTVWLDGVKPVPASNANPFDLTSIATFRETRVPVKLAAGQAVAAEVVVHVAPMGDDAGDGSRAKPVGSLIGARDAVRRLRAAGRTGPVRVMVADGTYRVAEPLVLTPEDGGSAEAPVRYEAAPGAKPVLSGGRKITGFRALENGLWVADVPGVAAGQWYFEQLWAGGHRARRAVEPDTGQFFFEEVVETDLGGGRFRQTVTVSQEVMSLLTPLSAAERADVKLLVFHSWNNTHRFISDIDAGRRTFSSEGPRALRPYSLWKDLAWGSKGYFHLENFLSALDEPGEWFLARDGKLYYSPRPGEDPTSMEFIAPVTGQFLQIQGDPASGRFVEHVHFKGLAFNHGQWLTPAGGYGPFQAASDIEAVVMLDGARNVVFEDCEIAHVGIYGLWFRRGCSQCRVERCLISDLGAGGVKIGEIRIRDNTAEQTHHITLDNNIIQSGGRIFTDAVGIWIGHSGDNNVTHNDIGDLYYSAVSVGWTWGFGNSVAKRNNISYNHLHHLGQRRMSDLAGVYSLGISDGTVISHNVIHDVYCWGYGGWGLYPDEGSSNILFENNLVYNVTDGGFHQHYGRENTVRNNILAFSEQEQVRGTAQKKAGDHLSFTFERNIVYFDQGELFGRPWQWEADVLADLRNNIYWRTDGKDLGFAGKSWDQWRTMGRDREGSIIADPKFVNPKSYDFRFASDKVIKQTGFQPFDYSRAGVYGYAAWIALAKTTPDSNKENNHDNPR